MSQLGVGRLPVVLALLALLAAIVVSSWWPPVDTASAHDDVYIYIRDYQYWTASGTSAQTVTIPAGTSVVWVNQDPWGHTVTGTGGCVWPCPVLESGDTLRYTFTIQGTFDYYCEIHFQNPNEKGRIVVGPPETATPTFTSTPTATSTGTPTPTSTPRPPSMVARPQALTFLADPTIAAGPTGQTNPQTIFMNNAGDLPYDWQAATADPWLRASPSTGRSGQTNPQVSVLLSQALGGQVPTQTLTLTGAISVTQITSPTKTLPVNVTFRYSPNPLVRSYFPVVAGGGAAPNNSFALAAFIGSSATVQGTLKSASEVDYFTFNVSISPGTASISLSNLPADFNLYLYDSSRSLLASSEQAGTTAESISRGALTSGKYYIKVAGAAGAFSDLPYTLQIAATEPTPTPSNTPTVTATPTLTATPTATVTQTPTPTPVDAFEPNNTLSAASPITPTANLSPYHGAITSVNDVDWFQFNVSQISARIQLSLFALSNYDLDLYASDGKLAASSTQLGQLSEWIDYTAPTPGSYFVQVRMGQNGSPSDVGYDLRVALLPAEDTPLYTPTATSTPSNTPTASATPTVTPTSTSTATPVDPYEPNNTQGEAHFIGPYGTLYSGAITSSSDVDWFGFNVPSEAVSGTIQARLINLPSNYDLLLFDQTDNWITTSARSGVINEAIDYSVPAGGAGTYHVMVQIGTGGQPSNTPYDLYVKLFSAGGTPLTPTMTPTVTPTPTITATVTPTP